MNYRKIERQLMIRIELFRALRYMAMSVTSGPTRYANAMFWQFEYLYILDQLDAIDDDQTIIDIGKLSMMCKGYTVVEDV